jgi:hypothetical protein
MSRNPRQAPITPPPPLPAVATQAALDAATTLAAAAIAASVAGLVPEAPNDGNFYARKGGAWVRVSVAALPAT